MSVLEEMWQQPFLVLGDEMEQWLEPSMPLLFQHLFHDLLLFHCLLPFQGRLLSQHLSFIFFKFALLSKGNCSISSDAFRGVLNFPFFWNPLDQSPASCSLDHLSKPFNPGIYLIDWPHLATEILSSFYHRMDQLNP